MNENWRRERAGENNTKKKTKKKQNTLRRHGVNFSKSEKSVVSKFC